ALAGHPAWPMGMIEKSAHQRPRFARILGFEEGGWLHTAIESVWGCRGTQRYFPDILEGKSRFRRKLDVGFQRVRPGLTEIVAPAQIRAPKQTARRGQQAMTAVATVIRKGINSLPVKVRSGDLPMLALPPGSQQEGALRCPHKQEHVAVLDI